MHPPVVSFRSAFWPVWCWSMSLCGALALIISAAAALSGWEVQPLPALTVAVVSGVLLALALAYYRVSVAADGLKCYDAFGIYHFAAWPTVERVRRARLIRTTGRRPIRSVMAAYRSRLV